MSLIGHWKLDGDTKDSSGYGNDGISEVVYASGKINEARRSGNFTVPASPEFNIIGDLSIAFWFNPDTNTTRRTVMQTHYNGSFCINHETEGDLRFYNGNGSSYDSLDSTVLTNGQWYHCVLTRESKLTTWYINGVYNTSRTSAYEGEGNHNLIIGSGYTAELDGYLDDVRLYNHALSIKEIHELSLAKVLHYDFNMFSEPTTNILENGDFSTGDITGWGTPEIRGVNHNDYYSIESDNINNYLNIHWERIASSGNDWAQCLNNSHWVVPNIPYTLTCQIRVNSISGGDSTAVRHSMVINDYWTSDKKYTYLNAMTIGVWTDVESTVLDPQPTYYKDPVTWDFNGTFQIYTGPQAAIGDYIDFDIRFAQVEQKDHSTPFVNGVRTGQIVDNSGNDNHSIALTEEDTPEWTTDSLLGSGAYYFDGNKEVATTPIKEMMGGTLTITMMTFVKITSSLGYNTSFMTNIMPWLGTYTNGEVRFIIRAGGLDQYNCITTEILSLNTRYHIAATYDGTTMKIYIDGVLKKSENVGLDLYLDSADTSFLIGTSSFEGYLDDIRLYSSALTVEDIYEIAHTRASIDDEGTLWAK